MRLFGVTGGELYSSMTDETEAGAPFPGDEECAHTGGALWRCDLPDQGSSSLVTYLVRVKGDGCWTARRVGPGGEGPLPSRSSACIGLDDLVRL